MGLIREYAMESQMGDPFFKKLKRLKIGRGLGKLGRRGLRFASRIGARLPGPIGGALALARRFGLEAGDFEDEDDLEDFSREQGYDMGDPGKRPPKRKTAGAGTRQKAKRKKDVRRERRRGRQGRFERGLGSVTRGIGRIGGRLLPGALNVGAQMLEKSGSIGRELGVDGEDDLQALAAAAGGRPMARGGFAPMRAGAGARQPRYTKAGGITTRKRPAMQVTNTRALKRSLSRVEGFAKLAKRIMPNLMKPAGAWRTRKGHKPGCKCVRCK